MDTGHARVRIVIRSVDIGTEDNPHNRGPLDPPVAILYDAGDIGAGEWLNTPGEIHFTLPGNHPQLSALEPFLVHFALEIERDVVGWVEVLAGLITDFDATADEVIFYGIDYLGLLGMLYEEAFSATVVDAAYNKGGSKYSNKAISFIIENQLKRAKALDFSPVGFISVPDITDWPEKITINAVFKQRLEFILGLMQSHAAGTGKRTRLRTVKTGALTYRWDAQDAPGTNRDDLRFEYGGLAQAFQVVPFDDFGTKVMGIGLAVAGLKPMYAVAHPPNYSDTNEPFPEWYYGSFPKTAAWQDLIDKNDLKRRAALMARRAGKVGKKVGIGIRVDSLDVKVGWDICDAVPVDIIRGAVDSTKYGSGYYVIVGWEFKVFRDGHTDLILSLQPKDDNIAVDLTLLPSDPVQEPGIWAGQSGCGHPTEFEIPSDVKFFFDHCSGLVYERLQCDTDLDPLACTILPAISPTMRYVQTDEAGVITKASTTSIQALRLGGNVFFPGALHDRRTTFQYSVPAGATYLRLRYKVGGVVSAGSRYVAGYRATGSQSDPLASDLIPVTWTLGRLDPAVNVTTATAAALWAATEAAIPLWGQVDEARNLGFTDEPAATGYTEPDPWTTDESDIYLTISDAERAAGRVVLAFQNLSTDGGYGFRPTPTELEARIAPITDPAPAGALGPPSFLHYRISSMINLVNAVDDTDPNVVVPFDCNSYFELEDIPFEPTSITPDVRKVRRDGLTQNSLPIGDPTAFIDSWAAVSPAAQKLQYSDPDIVLGFNGLVEDRAILRYTMPDGIASLLTIRFQMTSGYVGIGQAGFPKSWLLERIRPGVDPAGGEDWFAGPGIEVASGTFDVENLVIPVYTDMTANVSVGPDEDVVYLRLTDTSAIGLNVAGPPVPTLFADWVPPVLGSLTSIVTAQRVEMVEFQGTFKDCWVARPPIVWDPDGAIAPTPAGGQFVPERQIAVGDGINAFFYLTVPNTIPPFSPPEYASPYMPGTVRIKVDGTYQAVGESDPATGQILLGFVPEIGEKIRAEWRTAVVTVVVP